MKRLFIKTGIVVTNEHHKPIFTVMSDAVPFDCAITEDFATQTEIVQMVQEDLEELRTKALLILQG